MFDLHLVLSWLSSEKLRDFPGLTELGKWQSWDPHPVLRAQALLQHAFHHLPTSVTRALFCDFCLFVPLS